MQQFLRYYPRPEVYNNAATSISAEPMLRPRSCSQSTSTLSRDPGVSEGIHARGAGATWYSN